MPKHPINIQDGYLFQSLKEARPLVVSLMTGQQLEGRLRRFDRFAIILETEGGEEILLYKHAVASIRSAQGDA